MSSVTAQRVLCLQLCCVHFHVCQATTVDFHPTTAGNSRCVHHVCAPISSVPRRPICTNADSLMFEATSKPSPPSPTSHTYSNATIPLHLTLLSHCVHSHVRTEGEYLWDAVRGKNHSVMLTSRQAGVPTLSQQLSAPSYHMVQSERGLETSLWRPVSSYETGCFIGKSIKEQSSSASVKVVGFLPGVEDALKLTIMMAVQLGEYTQKPQNHTL